MKHKFRSGLTTLCTLAVDCVTHGGSFFQNADQRVIVIMRSQHAAAPAGSSAVACVPRPLTRTGATDG